MNKILTLALLGAFCFSASAQIEKVDFYCTGVHTGTLTCAWTSAPVRGKLLSMSIKTSTNMTVGVTTVANIGMSVPAAKTIFAANTNVAAATGIQTNFSDTHYLYDDKLVMSASAANGTNPLQTATGFILIDTKP